MKNQEEIKQMVVDLDAQRKGIVLGMAEYSALDLEIPDDLLDKVDKIYIQLNALCWVLELTSLKTYD